MSYDFEILDKTGLKMKGELDTLFGMSRVSLYNYKAGKTVPSKHTAGHTALVLSILSTLVKLGKLPFHADTATDSERRKAAIKKLQDYVDARRLAN